MSFRLAMVLGSVLLTVCMEPVVQDVEFLFTVVDVGEGLAQIGAVNNHALLWDVGPADAYRNVYNAYLHLGKPRIEYIIISHSDLDHCGGLSMLDTALNWSGKLAVSPFEDTAYLRMLSCHWSKKVEFLIVKKGEVLNCLENVNVNCLWPPDNSPFASGKNKNINSLVFNVTYGRTRCLITSDIDSSVQNLLIQDVVNLQSDILVVPHHGSENFSPFFIQYINPVYAIISCSDNNTYGHPSDKVLANLLSFGTTIHLTFSDGTLTFKSNTFYWSE